jgi:hypothetical protein
MALEKSELLSKIAIAFFISSLLENMLHNCLLKVVAGANYESSIYNYELTITNYDDYECFEK